MKTTGSLSPIVSYAVPPREIPHRPQRGRWGLETCRWCCCGWICLLWMFPVPPVPSTCPQGGGGLGVLGGVFVCVWGGGGREREREREICVLICNMVCVHCYMSYITSPPIQSHTPTTTHPTTPPNTTSPKKYTPSLPKTHTHLHWQPQCIQGSLLNWPSTFSQHPFQHVPQTVCSSCPSQWEISPDSRCTNTRHAVLWLHRVHACHCISPMEMMMTWCFVHHYGKTSLWE